MMKEMMIDKYCQVIGCNRWSSDFLKKSLINIDITNIAEWLFLYSGKERFNYDDFPNQAPAWPFSWFEYSMPPVADSEGNIIEFFENIEKVGIFRVMEKDNHGWIGLIYVYLLSKNGRLGLIGSALAKINDDGTVNYPMKYIPGDMKVYEGDKAVSWEQGFELFAVPLFAANSFMHCKNVEFVDQIPTKIENQKRKKKGKLPFFRFKTLNIQGVRKIIDNEMEKQNVGLKKALHICRGHFATYTDENPLFGKITGTFWKPMHLRGNGKIGTIIKDYSV